MMASTITFGLFAFMAFLISNEQVGIAKIPAGVIIDVIGLPEDTKVEALVRHKFEPPKPPPVMQQNRVMAEVIEVNSEYSYTPTELTVTSNAVDLLIKNNQRDRDARPIVRVNPKYPISALRNGVQGWVVLAFDISKIGEVINVKVLDSQPKRIFDKAAKQALKKWKYRAKLVDGKQVSQQNFTVQLDFNMDQQS